MQDSLVLLPPILLFVIIFISFISNRKSSAANAVDDRNEASESEMYQRTYQMLMNSQLSTAILNMDASIVFCNCHFARILNNSPEKLIGQNLLEHYPWPRNGQLYDKLESIFVKQVLPTKPYLLCFRIQEEVFSRSEIDLLALLRHYRESDRDFILFVLTYPVDSDLIFDDMLNSLKKKDSDLKRLEEIDQLKSEFLATLSHELKTPLVSIKGYMDLMASGKFGPLTEQQEKALRVSLKNTSHLNSMISSILNFARMEAGKLRFDMAPQRISSLISDTIDSMKPIADRQEIEIINRMSAELPKVMIDAELINRVLINLLDNAIKFSEPGKTVEIKGEIVSEELVRISVIDSGCGIPEDKIDKIKRPFYQADKSDTRPRGGLGLGLAICEKILEGHHTSLAINAGNNSGTCVSFMLKTAD